MKKIILIIRLATLFLLGALFGKTMVLKCMEIDGVNEIDNGIITIKLFNEYYDYEYEYTEITDRILE